MLSRLSDGDLLLLGARPGHGKTLLGLQLLLDAVRDGGGKVYSSHWSTPSKKPESASDRWKSKTSGIGDALEIVTSDDICAAYITRYLGDACRGTVAVVDYLQILDQRRSSPELSEQLSVLQGLAQQTGVVLAFISQLDRSYDPETKPLPGLQDLRLPNKVDVGLFSKACFFARR